HAGEILLDQLLRRPDDSRIERDGGCKRFVPWYQRDFQAWIADRRFEGRKGALRSLPRKDTAVHICTGALRKCVAGMTAVEERCNASGVQQSIIEAVLGDLREGGSVIRLLCERHHRSSQLVTSHGADLG